MVVKTGRIHILLLCLCFFLSSVFAQSETSGSSKNAIESISGTFLLECAEGIATSKLTFDGEKLVQVDTFYKSGTDCTEQEGVIELTYDITYPGGSTATRLGQAIHINYKLVAATADGDNIFSEGGIDHSIILLDEDNLYVANGLGRNTDQRTETLKSEPFIRMEN